MLKKLIRQLEHGRFVLIGKRVKRNLEEAWTLSDELFERGEGGVWVNKKTGELYRVKGEVYRRELTNYPIDHPKVQEHLANGGNLGYLCGSNKIYVFDLDNKESLKEFEDILGETLTTETNRGYHLYAEYDGELYRLNLEKNGVHLGELQGIGQQVLVPPSIHPSGKEYSVYKDLPIVKLTKEKLDLIKEKFTTVQKTFEVKSPNWSQYQKTNLSDQISIASLVDISKFKPYGSEYFGIHPIHGSTTGQNFFVNPIKNLWHCFRHDSGGDSLSYLAVKEGICNCEDFSKNGEKLRGENFKRVLQIGKERYGLKTELPITATSSQLNIKMITAKELSELNIPAPSYLVDNILPDIGVSMFAGKPASLKSFLATAMSVCSAYGLPFLNKFKTKKTEILYFDGDNPLRLTKDKTEKVVTGLGVEFPQELKYISHSGLKLDNEQHMEVLEQIAKENQGSLVIFDSWVRFLSHTNENDAGEVSNILNRLRRISELYKISFLIIHHLRKGSKDKSDEQDERVRGSSDLVASLDSLLIVTRKDKTSPYIYVRQEKNRYDKELDPFVILINQNPETNSVSFELTSSTTPEQNIESKAAIEILNWLNTEKEWADPANKIFKTAEVNEKFEGKFNPSHDRNRKIIQGALSTLVSQEKMQHTETKGYYKFAKFLDLDKFSNSEVKKDDSA